MKSKLFIVLILTGLVLAGCGTTKAQPTEVPVAPTDAQATEQQGTGGGTSEIANPASEHCVDQGYQLEIRTDESGNQYGVCIFPDGSECEEWAFFRGECTYQGE